MKDYCIGFVVSLDGTQVLLLRKNRPAFLAGQWVGVGGHVESGESAHEAMVREAQEEAGLAVPAWELLGELERPGARIAVFAAVADIALAHSCMDEPIDCVSWTQLTTLPLTESSRACLPALAAFIERVRNLQRPRPR